MSNEHYENKLLAQRNRFVPQGPFNTTPLFAANAQGAVITDVEGRELIDFAGGIGVVNVGHCHPKVVAAIKDQADRFIHTCFHVVMYEAYGKLAEKLLEHRKKGSEKVIASDAEQSKKWKDF